MIELKDLLEENETLVTFHLCNEYWSRNAITVKGSDDISGALEMTLHRILEAGGTENDVKRIMGAEIPTEDELKELEEFDEFSWIDLGYVLPGLIDLWKETVTAVKITVFEFRFITFSILTPPQSQYRNHQDHIHCLQYPSRSYILPLHYRLLLQLRHRNQIIPIQNLHCLLTDHHRN